MFQFFVQVHCNPVKITFKVQERVIWNLWIWGKYFSAHFFHYFPLKSLPDLLWLPVDKIMNLGEVFLPHIYHICGGWNFWSTNDSFVGEFFFELLHKNHQRLDNFAAFLHIYSTYLSYSLNGISQYVSFEEFSFSFTVVSSTSKQFKDLHNILLWLNVSVFILFILLLLKHIPLTVATVAIFLHTKDPSLSDGLDAPACFRWKWNVWTVQRLLVL